MSSLLKFLIFILSLIVLFTACGRKLKVEKVRKIIYVELVNGYSSKQFAMNYSSYSPSELSRSNRTLNEYRVYFNTDSKMLESLIDQLSTDEGIINYREVNEPQAPTNSTSKKKSSVPAIKNNG